jgi:hypothetical protein
VSCLALSALTSSSWVTNTPADSQFRTTLSTLTRFSLDIYVRGRNWENWNVGDIISSVDTNTTPPDSILQHWLRNCRFFYSNFNQKYIIWI